MRLPITHVSMTHRCSSRASPRQPRTWTAARAESRSPGWPPALTGLFPAWLRRRRPMPRETKANPENRGPTAQLEPTAPREDPGPQDFRDRRVRLGNQARPGLPERRVQPGPRANRASRAQPGPPDRRDLQVKPALPERRAPPVPPGRRVKRALPGPPDRRAKPALQVPRDRLDLQAKPALRGLPAQPDLLEHRAQQDPPASQAGTATASTTVPEVRPAPWGPTATSIWTPQPSPSTDPRRRECGLVGHKASLARRGP